MTGFTLGVQRSRREAQATRFGPQTSHTKFAIYLTIFPHKMNAVIHFHREYGVDSNGISSSQ